RGFLDHVEHLMSAAGASESDAPVEGVEPDAVRLMSIHGAKGLEFPVVCIADLGRAPNTRMPDLLVDGTRLGLALVRLDGGKATPTLEYEQLAEERRRAEAEEEDRILYVAMTRARERIVLSGAVDFERWPEPRRGGTPISWLAPTLSAELPTLGLAGSAGVHDLPVGAEGRATIRCHLNTPARHAVGDGTGGRAPQPSTSDAHGAPDVEPAIRCAAPEDREEPLGGAASASSAEASDELGAGIATLSYTSLSELERCGYRYYLERVLGLGEDRAAARAQEGARGAGARARGTLVHRLLESLDFRAPAAPDAARIAELARELGMRLPSDEGEQIAALIETAAHAPLARRIASAEEIRREHPFAFALRAGGELVTGVIDLLAREGDGGYVVLDYKSDQIGPSADLEALVEREYAVQRLLYALAVLREGAEHVEIVHWFLERPAEPVHVRYAASERPRLEEDLQGRLANARKRGFSVSEHPHRGLCLTCPGRGALCSWDESQTMREDPSTAWGPPETVI
ncbi:MAG TPA: PD-(D/E)XK nuclease family protein, partial [Solirubrobacteraceae bacterium]